MCRSNFKQKTIMMVGPDLLARGGISNVIQGYFDSGIMENNGIDYFPTYQQGKKITKIIFYLNSLPLIFKNLKKYKILHVHTASKWSFRRLSLILILGKMFKKKAVVHIHGGGFESYYHKSSNVEKCIIKSVLNISDRIVVLTKSYKDFFSTILNTSKIY